MNENLSTGVRTASGVTILEFEGRITAGSTAIVLREAVRREADKNPKLILNLDKVTYCDSAGLGELVGCHTAMLNRRGSIKLCSLRQPIKQLLHVTRLNTLFEVYENEAAALDSFGGGARTAHTGAK